VRLAVEPIIDAATFDRAHARRAARASAKVPPRLPGPVKSENSWLLRVRLREQSNLIKRLEDSDDVVSVLKA
jgi:hypothetical protein